MKNLKLKPVFIATLLALGVSASAQAEEGRYIIQVDNNNKGLVKALTQKMGGQIKVDSNGFIAAQFSGKSLSDVKGILNSPHIKLIEEDQIRKPSALFNDDIGNPMAVQVTPYAVYQAQADQVTFDSGTGMKVCVIDSGLDSSNPDFLWDRINGDNDSGTGNWFEAGGEHGTHVAGTIAAADNTFGVVGMAPGVDLHIIKVFNSDGWGYSSDLAQAANLCAAAGANIISMSLGGGGANSTEENAFKDFTANGGLVVAAAGNDANSVRSYPAGYSSVMMIGANDADNNIADFSQYPGCTTGRGRNVTTDETICVEVTAGGVNTLSTFPAGLASAAGLNADTVAYDTAAMENNGTATGSTYFMGTAEAEDAAASGKICVIDRGVISFHDKVLNCENSGGLGAVIINNVSGLLYGTLGDATTNTTTIAAVGTALEDRSALLAATNMDISVTASDYGFLSGTSMATPAVSGIAALVWSNHPECSGSQIRQVLKDTAKDLGAAGKDEFFGYGMVQAADADAYITANGCDGGVTPPPGGDFTLSANGYKSKGSQFVDLTWSGATSTNVDVYRDGALIATTANDEAATDALNVKGGGVYSYQICEEASSTCTSTVQVVF
ncbi:MAG: subtilisin family serine protease [Paraglaciecola sp.]|jgi:subtilisin family serine protease